MKITLLGTGTPAPSLKRMSSGYLLEIGSDVVVVDHGPGAHHRLLETGKRAVDVTHCFLSHLHYDHFMDYPRLLMTHWDQGAGKVAPLKVFGPPPLAETTGMLIGEGGIYGPDIAARTKHSASLDIYRARGGEAVRHPPTPEVNEINSGDVIELDGWRVTVASGWHAQPYLTCLAFRFDSAEGSVCYSGDSGGQCPEVIALAKGCDVLIHMNHYFSGTEPNEAYRRFCGNHIDTAHVAKEAGVGTVVLTHITEQIDKPGLRERIVQEMAEIYSGTVIWGEDLMTLPLRQNDFGPID